MHFRTRSSRETHREAFNIKDWEVFPIWIYPPPPFFDISELGVHVHTKPFLDHECLNRMLREALTKKVQILNIVQISKTPLSSLDTKSLDTREAFRLPPRSLDTKSLKVYIRSASFVDKVPIEMVYERL